jgi:hypothetical protein
MIGMGVAAIKARYMTTDLTDWHQALARVSGQLVRGQQRVTTHELLTVHLGVPVTDQACRRLRRVMRDLGWHGPRLMRWGKKTFKGYWRHPTVGLPAIMQGEPVAEVATAERETLAPELERVTLLGLQKLEQILRIPTDRGDGNLLRAQTAAAGLAVNVQMRVDEAKMKQVRRTDIMARIIESMNQEKARLAEMEAQMAEDERRKRGGSEGPAAARTDIVGPSTCAEDLPAQGTNGRA